MSWYINKTDFINWQLIDLKELCGNSTQEVGNTLSPLVSIEILSPLGHGCPKEVQLQTSFVFSLKMLHFSFKKQKVFKKKNIKKVQLPFERHFWDFHS